MSIIGGLLRRNSRAVNSNKLIERQLCFMHIGKTAGTSFFHLLCEELNDLAHFHASPEAFDKLIQKDLDNYKLITGHFSFNHTSRFRSDRYLITFLRDPVDRVLSNYYFLRNWDGVINDSNCEMVRYAKQLSLMEFLKCDNPQVESVTRNHQAYSIASDFRDLRKLSDRELRRKAIGNLELIDFIGITEEFEKSVEMLFSELGRSLSTSLERKNVTLNRLGVSGLKQEEMDLIMELNQIDMEVYLLAKRSHGKRILR